MTSGAKPTTFGELKQSGYNVQSVKQEMRQNLITRIREGRPVFDGIFGYEESVVPQLENAILSGQDIIFLGERGQAKSRMIRSLTGLLDESIPVIAGSELNENPFHPITHASRIRCRCKSSLSRIVSFRFIFRQQSFPSFDRPAAAFSASSFSPRATANGNVGRLS